MSVNPPAADRAGKSSDNRILKRMLERLFASLVNGPGLNCRPHSSRQRIDLTQLAKLKDRAPEQILRTLLGPDREVSISAKVAAPKGRAASAWNKRGAAAIEEEADDDHLSPQEKAARIAWRDQQAVFGKLRTIAEDARTYENDTGVHCLQIGFPLLSLPPGGGSSFGLTRRILAPLAFISLSMTVKAGGVTPSANLECRNEGADLVVPNAALLAWIEAQTGQPIGELFNDDTGEKPWSEIVAISQRVAELLKLSLPDSLIGEEMPAEFTLAAAPRSTDDEEEPRPTVLPAAVVGLYPMANQGLLRDMQALAGGEPASGPIESFIKLGVSLDAPANPVETEQPVEKRTRTFAEERLVTIADPCQARAVRLARTTRGLVMHGPPGTGKSQTIANIIGDHLARGERVLFVCEKRTALDVVLNRLESMGIGSLCGIVHDPQRDQRELYKSIREQLDTLSETRSDASADGALARVDAELQKLHGELTDYHTALMKRPGPDALSFHELMGQWLELPSQNIEFDSRLVAAAPLATVELHAQAITDLLNRAQRVGYATNPWTAAAGLSLDDFLQTHADDHRASMQSLVAASTAVDAALDSNVPPFGPSVDLSAAAAARARLADELPRVMAAAPLATRTKWLGVDASELDRARKRLDEAASLAKQIDAAALDPELATIVRDAPPTAARIAEETAVLTAYIESSKKLLSFLAFGTKNAAAAVLTKYGLQPSPANAQRVVTMLAAIRARLTLRDVLRSVIGDAFAANTMPDDQTMRGAITSHAALLNFLVALGADAALATCATL